MIILVKESVEGKAQKKRAKYFNPNLKKYKNILIFLGISLPLDDDKMTPKSRSEIIFIKVCDIDGWMGQTRNPNPLSFQYIFAISK